MKKQIFDIIGIGLGPFNLGLSALLHPIKSLNSLFLEQNRTFDWHSGMMIPGATMQVGFYADLVTLADPTNPFSYLAYLKETHRLINFGIWEKTYISRIDYRNYCRWVTGKQSNLLFNHQALEIKESKSGFALKVNNVQNDKEFILETKNIVLGLGSTPFIPQQLQKNNIIFKQVFHSSEYMNYRSQLEGKSIMVIGSGQSAAEIILDLLTMQLNNHNRIRWVTRTERLIPMDFSKLNLELSSPDYIQYFYSLSDNKRSELLEKQSSLYKGINKELIDRIYDFLYEWQTDNNERPSFEIHTATEALAIEQGNKGEYMVKLFQKNREQYLQLKADVVILATGYSTKSPLNLLSSLEKSIELDREGMPKCSKCYDIYEGRIGKIYIQNAEMNTHGFNAADLSLGPYRNGCIINSILNKTYYDITNLPVCHQFI